MWKETRKQGNDTDEVEMTDVRPEIQIEMAPDMVCIILYYMHFSSCNNNIFK